MERQSFTEKEKEFFKKFNQDNSASHFEESGYYKLLNVLLILLFIIITILYILVIFRGFYCVLTSGNLAIVNEGLEWIFLLFFPLPYLIYFGEGLRNGYVYVLPRYTQIYRDTEPKKYQKVLLITLYGQCSFYYYIISQEFSDCLF